MWEWGGGWKPPAYPINTPLVFNDNPIVLKISVGLLNAVEVAVFDEYSQISALTTIDAIMRTIYNIKIYWFHSNVCFPPPPGENFLGEKRASVGNN